MLASRPSESPASRAWVATYLALLGVEHAPPSLEALGRLVRAQICTVPFENTTAILRRRAHPDGPVPPVDPDVLLENWARGRGGGVCFELAEMFGRLLVALGYRAHPVLGRISFPGSHQAVVVGLEGRRYLAEVSNGAPFFEPIPLDRVVEIRRLGLAYRFRPDGEGDRWVQDRLIDGAWEPFCTYDLRPPAPAACEAAYQRHHAPGASWVMDDVRLVRCREDQVCAIRGRRFSRYTAAEKRSEVVSGAEAARLAADVFGMPHLPVEAALAAQAERMPAPTA